MVIKEYLVLRNSLEDQQQKARVSAIYNVFAFAALIPLLFILPRMTDSSLHPGNGGNPGDKERGDVGPAEVTGKLNLYGAYVGDTFRYDEKTTFSGSARANIAFVELIDGKR